MRGEPMTDPRVLLVVENFSVPSDRRVWQEATSLVRSGYDVTVICPRGTERDTAPYELLDGVAIHRFELDSSSGGVRSHLREYSSALLQIGRLARQLSQERRFDVVHICNPPDVVLPWLRLVLGRSGTRYVFDQHDLVPELFRTRFGTRRHPLYWASRVFERISYQLADLVIVPNESYRELALRRGRRNPGDVYVVRNGPDLARFRPLPPDDSLKRARRHLIVYAGVMGAQDGVDRALQALGLLKETRDDWYAVFAGEGECLPDLLRERDSLGLAEDVDFPGWLTGDQLLRVLSTADVCLAPEPRSPLNEVSTLIKVAEYMAMGKPVVSLDLPESRLTAGDAAAYAADNVESFAETIESLLADPNRRAEMGDLGRRRVEEKLSWRVSEEILLDAFARAAASPGRWSPAVLAD